jgi:Protein of unknown function (DUF4435)
MGQNDHGWSGDIRSVNAWGIANRVRQMRPVHDGSFLLVEGVDEDKLYRNFMDYTRCRIQIAHGKPNVLGALAILDEEGFRGALAIVDADFSVLEGTRPGSPNIVHTDTHDLETMLLASPALDRVLAERGDASKLAALGDDVRRLLLALGEPIGYLRWLSVKQMTWIRFDDLEIDEFVDEKTLTVDLEKLLATLRNRSKALIVVDAEVWRLAEALKEPGHDLWHVCCGHDLVRILSVALRKVLGSNKPSDVQPSGLEERLRLSFSLADFQATRLWGAIIAWEKENPPYVVLSLAR